MEFKKPSNFKEMLELQKTLDEKLGSTNRTEEQICLSIIAEVIEFNEELECSHKTWKTKTDHTIEKQKEELIDCVFFFLQLLNFKKHTYVHFDINKFSRMFDTIDCDKIFQIEEVNGDILDLIHAISFFDYYMIANILIKFINYFEISQDELYELYFDKWNKNYFKRAEKKVEEGGWL